MNPMVILIYIAVAVFYGLYIFVMKRAENGETETFEPEKLVRIILAGVIVGLILFLRGSDIEINSIIDLFETVLSAGGPVVLLDQLIIAYQGWKERKG